MRIPVTQSAFDVAEWFLDTALTDGVRLQPMRLQQLMFLAQGYYAALSKGGRLIPCVFVATQIGPVEPNTFCVYAKGTPDIVKTPLSATATALLDTVWRKFGSYSPEFLSRMVIQHDPYVAAIENGANTEIDLEVMRDFYTRLHSEKNSPGAQSPNQPRVMRSQTGKNVTVRKWEPGKR